MKIYKVTEQEAKEHILAVMEYGVSLHEIDIMLGLLIQVVANYKLRDQAVIYFRALKQLKEEKTKQRKECINEN